MSETYEIRLKKEYDHLCTLQRHPEMKKIITIQYKERIGSSGYKSIIEKPTSPLYPKDFRVTYTMPMYVGEGQLKSDWSATFLFSVPENILMDSNSSLGVDIEGGTFPKGSVPFNNHISPGWVCTGTAWGVANQGFGIWYFIISLGCLFNQEKFMMASDPDDESKHLNSDAFRYWKNVHKMQPNNRINWPFNLLDIGDNFGVSNHVGGEKISFGERNSPNIDEKKSSFTFGEKKEVSKPSFTFGKKE